MLSGMASISEMKSSICSLCFSFWRRLRQDPLDGEVVPPGLASRGRDAVLRQLSGDGVRRHSCEEISVNPADDFSLRLVDDQHAVRALVVAQEVLVVQAELAVANFLPLAPAHVLGNAPAFFLGKAGHNGQ